MDNGQKRKTERDVHLSLETEINVIEFFLISLQLLQGNYRYWENAEEMFTWYNRLENIDLFQLFREIEGIA